MRALVVAIHDVAPSTWEEARALRDAVRERTGGPVTLLLVPRYRGLESWRAGPAAAWARARARGGDEIALHGWAHVRPDGRDGAELARLPAAAVAGAVADGAAELRRAGIEPRGFIAPAYGHPPSAAAACREVRIGWWATRLALRWEDGVLRLPSLGLGASTPARRALSPAAARATAGLLAPAPAVRLDLHPADLAIPRLERAGRDLLDMLLDQGRRVVSHEALRDLAVSGWRPRARRPPPRRPGALRPRGR